MIQVRQQVTLLQVLLAQVNDTSTRQQVTLLQVLLAHCTTNVSVFTY